MKILVTNDDGYTKEGIKKLVKEAMKYGECIVVAPMKEQSGKSHSLCIREEMAFKQVEDIIPGVKTYYLDSTPADCVRVAHYYLKCKIDIIYAHHRHNQWQQPKKPIVIFLFVYYLIN